MKLCLKELKKSFGSQVVLDGISYCFEEGKIYGLLGKNGAGKTTLFNCISGEIPLDSGGFFLREASKEEALQREDIGYVFSTAVLPEFMTGYEFIHFYIRINQAKVDPGKTIEDYFDEVDIQEEDRHKLIRQYSLGMKNKIQMMMFLITKPKVILLDEPLTSLDVMVAYNMKQNLLKLKDDHIIIFSTHIMQLAMDLCDEIVVLQDGEFQYMINDQNDSKAFEHELIQIFEGHKHVENI